MDIFTPSSHKSAIPLVEGIHAGFPSPAEDFAEPTLDLNHYVIKNPASTFYARIKGDSMVGANIQDGDIVVIDKSLEPADGSIAVCFIDGDFTVKRLSVRADGIYLTPANASFPELKVSEDSNFQVWGIVSHIIKRL
jgi:DNA polymerase V